jgi:Ca-activated chloride channel family protein
MKNRNYRSGVSHCLTESKPTPLWQRAMLVPIAASVTLLACSPAPGPQPADTDTPAPPLVEHSINPSIDPYIDPAIDPSINPSIDPLNDSSINQTVENDDRSATPGDIPAAVIHSEEVKIDAQRQMLVPSATPGKQSADRLSAYAHKSMTMMRENTGLAHLRMVSEPLDRENYATLDANPVHLVAEDPVSTFSIDVDTGSYANVRRFLNGGQLPPQDAVRVEELINYFSYDYSVPDSKGTPFSINTEVATTPWNPDTLLLQVGLKGYEVQAAQRPAANLVFLMDVSGSMNSPDKLPLLKNAFRLLTKQLDENDSISMVVYAGASGVVLEPTPGNQKATIMNALEQLSAGGSTNGAAGIRQAYAMAEQAFIEDGINRVILATDGDFNVGTVNFEALVDLVQERRKQGIALTTLGFGTGNYNDHLMEQLADEGNGNYAYIDGLREARKVLVEELSSTLQIIAKDVKIQIEFNPAVVSEYRLIGYENRMLNREDFNNDRVDAGEIGAGHTVTALYELSLVDGAGRLVDPLRYGQQTASDSNSSTKGSDELAFVRLRYKEPDADVSKLIERPVLASDIEAAQDASEELRFAGAVAAFGQQLRGGEYLEDFGFADIRKLAATARGEDSYGYRAEFISLVDLADTLAPVAANRQASR